MVGLYSHPKRSGESSAKQLIRDWELVVDQIIYYTIINNCKSEMYPLSLVIHEHFYSVHIHIIDSKEKQ